MKISTFIQEARQEAKHISWPRKKTTTLFTVGVVVISIVIGYYIGFFDFIFTSILGLII